MLIGLTIYPHYTCLIECNMQRKMDHNGCYCLSNCLMSCVNGLDVWSTNKLFLFYGVYFLHIVDIFRWQMQLIAVPIFAECVATLITLHDNDVKVNISSHCFSFCNPHLSLLLPQEHVKGWSRIRPHPHEKTANSLISWISLWFLSICFPIEKSD